MLKSRSESMTVPEFREWWDRHPEPGVRFELHDGRPVRLMSPETVGHGRAKLRITMRLNEAIRQAELDCEAVVDSANVYIDESNTRIPYASVVCGGNQDSDSIWLDRPVILVEGVSPTSERRDVRDKLLDYFRIETVHHYLVLFPSARRLIHHCRGLGDEIITRILTSGTIDLSPPGFSLSVDDLLMLHRRGWAAKLIILRPSDPSLLRGVC